MSDERPDNNETMNPWDADLGDPRLDLRIASERLSLVRYVFLVQIEDGIATAGQRASLEYADAVLIGWPENDSREVVDLDERQLAEVKTQMSLMERHILAFRRQERDGDIDGMTDTLVKVTACVAVIRGLYQPDFPLPTFAEIRQVVQDEWDEDMDRIDANSGIATVDGVERETREADGRQADAEGGDVA
ncbi:MAG TPA: phosphoribosylglycinamide synthetase [Bifidobacterium pullorum]|nr:phosphoribosylglycinamide synthetase [Bifidobacterium pullorum]